MGDRQLIRSSIRDLGSTQSRRLAPDEGITELASRLNATPPRSLGIRNSCSNVSERNRRNHE
jgi:hypothetical protein